MEHWGTEEVNKFPKTTHSKRDRFRIRSQAFWLQSINTIILKLPAAAAAKSLQSCSTLYDPIDGSLPGSPCSWDSPGKNTGVGCISFSNAWKWKVKVKSLSCLNDSNLSSKLITMDLVKIHHVSDCNLVKRSHGCQEAKDQTSSLMTQQSGIVSNKPFCQPIYDMLALPISAFTLFLIN